MRRRAVFWDVAAIGCPMCNWEALLSGGWSRGRVASLNHCLSKTAMLEKITRGSVFSFQGFFCFLDLRLQWSRHWKYFSIILTSLTHVKRFLGVRVTLFPFDALVDSKFQQSPSSKAMMVHCFQKKTFSISRSPGMWLFFQPVYSLYQQSFFKKNVTNELTYKAETDSQTLKTNL